MPHDANRIYLRRGRSAAILTTLLGLALHTGCYASHTIPLEGERYECECSWTQLVPRAEVDCDSDGCTVMPCVSVECLEEVRSVGSVNPCTTFEADAEEVCAAACADPQFAPALLAEHDVTASVHADAGWCSTNGDPPRTFFFPEVPSDAVRNGHVVAELSELRVSVGGVGTSETIQPVHGTPVTIQGGNCDGVSPCDMSINYARIEVAGPVSLEGHTLDGLALTTSEGMISAAEVWPQMNPGETPPGEWRLRGDSSATSSIPFEFFASVDGTLQEGGIEWTRPLAMPEDGPGGSFDLRRGSPDPHMRFTGLLRDTLELDDGSTLDVTIEANLFVQFYSGAPVPDMRVIDTGVATEPLIFDGSGSYDELGAPMAEHEWLLRAPDGTEVMLARGVRAVIPRAVWTAIKSEQQDLCLRVRDSDGLYDEVCMKLEATPGPGTPPPDCVESGTSMAGGWAFAEIIDMAGLRPWLASTKDVTLIVPSDAAIAAVFPGGKPEDDTEAQAFVLTHVLYGVHAFKDLEYGGVDLSANFADISVDLAPKDLVDETAVPDIDCHEGDGVVHRVGVALWPAAGAAIPPGK